jgi:ligand-binding SRPBCC domain-containing protein
LLLRSLRCHLFKLSVHQPNTSFLIHHIHLTTFISAPAERVFDLSRSIDLHITSTKETNEKAIGGKTKGLIELNETVTWQARHLLKTRTLISKITQMDLPNSFTDTMIEGDFKSYYHEHFFKPVKNGTIMIDRIYFEVPYGRFGDFAAKLFLKRYLEQLLISRNKVIKEFAEGQKWKSILKGVDAI